MKENDEQIIGILSYIGILWIVAYILYSNNDKNKTEQSIFHLRQGLGLFMIIVVIIILGYILIYIPIIGFFIMSILWLSVIILSVIGIINAANGEMKELPFIGKIISDNLKGFK